jgi:hypothetical protein
MQLEPDQVRIKPTVVSLQKKYESPVSLPMKLETDDAEEPRTISRSLARPQ